MWTSLGLKLRVLGFRVESAAPDLLDLGLSCGFRGVLQGRLGLRRMRKALPPKSDDESVHRLQPRLLQRLRKGGKIRRPVAAMILLIKIGKRSRQQALSALCIPSLRLREGLSPKHCNVYYNEDGRVDKLVLS